MNHSRVLTLTAIVFLAGCDVQFEEQVDSFPAGSGEITVTVKGDHKGMAGVTFSGVMLAYSDGSEIERSLPMIGNGYIAFYSDAEATVLRERDYDDYFHPNIGDEANRDRDVYVDPNEFTPREFEAIADCLQSHLDELDLLLSTERTIDGVKVGPKNYRIMSVRYFNPSSVPMRYVHEDDRNVWIGLNNQGHMYLQIPRPENKHVTHFLGAGVWVGAVVDAGKTVLLAEPAGIQEKYEFRQKKWLYNPFDTIDAARFYQQCKDSSGKTILENFDRQRLVPADQFRQHYAMTLIEEDGGLDKLIRQLENDPLDWRVVKRIRGAGSLATAARPILIECVKAGNSEAPRTLVNLGIEPDDDEVVDLIWQAWVSSLDGPSKEFRRNSYFALKRLGPQAAKIAPDLWDLMDDNPEDEARAQNVLFLLARITPQSPQLQTRLLEMLESDKPSIRSLACRTLSVQTKDAEYALPALRKVAARDPERFVRNTAQRAVEKIESTLEAQPAS